MKKLTALLLSVGVLLSMSACSGSKAVSYTHLDVYKRQLIFMIFPSLHF